MNLEEGKNWLFTIKKRKSLSRVKLGVLGKEMVRPPRSLDKITLLSQICSSRRVGYSKVKFQIQLCGSALVLLT